MNRTRFVALAVIIVLVGVIILGFLYAVPYGRGVRRESLRVFRLALNATGVYARPAISMKLWSPTRGVLLVDVYESGRVMVSGRGDAFERTLSPMISGEIFETARAALGDFSSDGCGTERGGVTAELYLLLDGRWVGSVCRDASDWPRGHETKRLLDQLANQVAGLSGRF